MEMHEKISDAINRISKQFGTIVFSSTESLCKVLPDYLPNEENEQLRKLLVCAIQNGIRFDFIDARTETEKRSAIQKHYRILSVDYGYDGELTKAVIRAFLTSELIGTTNPRQKSSPLTDFVIKEGVLNKYIGNETDVVIPNSVTKISGWSDTKECGFDWGPTLSAFNPCEFGINVTIPSTVVEIDDVALSCGCFVKSFFVDVDNPNYKSIGGVLFSKDGSRLIAFPNRSILTEYTIPQGTKIIGKKSFAGYYDRAQEKWFINKLKVILIPTGVTEIEANAFRGCIDLEKINLPPTLITIGNGAFEICHHLAQLIIPRSVSFIGVDALNAMSSLNALTVESDSLHYSTTNNVLYNKSGTNLIRFLSGNSVTSFSIPYGVEIIEAHAFEGCTKLTSITIPVSVMKVSTMSFAFCESLKNLTVQNRTLDLGGAWAFGVDLDEERTFLGCDSLSVIYCHKGSYAERWANINHYQVSYI